MNDTDKLQADICPVCGHKTTPAVPRWAKAVGMLILALGAVLALSVVVWLIALLWRNI